MAIDFNQRKNTKEKNRMVMIDILQDSVEEVEMSDGKFQQIIFINLYEFRY